jgi:deazaflavin-dependent oxidoreductase (nitroreductase family)
MGLLTPVGIRIAKISWMPNYLPQIVTVDKSLQKVTRGKVTLLDLAGLPNLVLFVKGRKSGIERETPLLCVPKDLKDKQGKTIYIAGSNFGQEKAPIWVTNLRAAGGKAKITFRRQTFEVNVVELEGEARAAAREIVIKTWPVFLKYEERTAEGRTIPIFELTRV